MTEIKYDPWKFNVNVEATEQYYKDYDNLCSCAICRNFYANVTNINPRLKSFLEQFGIDASKPTECPSVTVNKEENLVDNEVCYSVFGVVENWDRYEIDFDEVNIVVRASKPENVSKHPKNYHSTKISEPHFIFEIYNVWTPWTVEDDINECFSKSKKKPFPLKKLFSK